MTLPRERTIIEGDPTRLEQIISNLLTNAAKYTETGGRIGLEGRRDGDEIFLRCSDSGIGIPAEMLSRVFDPFVQIHEPGDSGNSGLGIGLSLTRSLVELHGGKISGSSAGLGRGSEFLVRLPAAIGSIASEERAAEDVGEPATESKPPRTSRAKTKRHVLVVEDNLDVAEMLCEWLRVEGHEARAVHDGSEALSAALELEADLILLDIGLPGESGYDVARRLRGEPGLEGVKLVALTGYGGPADRRRSQAAGFDMHLTKPVAEEALRNLLQS